MVLMVFPQAAIDLPENESRDERTRCGVEDALEVGLEKHCNETERRHCSGRGIGFVDEAPAAERDRHQHQQRDRDEGRVSIVGRHLKRLIVHQAGFAREAIQYLEDIPSEASRPYQQQPGIPVDEMFRATPQHQCGKHIA
jgi:hypothetical protein